MEPKTDRAEHNDGSQVRSKACLDAGQIPASMKRYVVTWTHNHKTLKTGDVVVMTEDREFRNWLLREPDMTLHSLQDESGQYVHLGEASNGLMSDGGQKV